MNTIEPRPQHRQQRPRRRASRALVRTLVVGALAATAFGCTSESAGPPSTTGTTSAATSTTGAPIAIVTGRPLETPPVYTSAGGRLHIQVKAEQVASTINEQAYNNIYSYTTSLVGDEGTYTPGTASAYVGPEWHVLPGDQLIVDYINALPDQSFTPVGSTEAQNLPQPINLHTHGLTVRPDGNSDNVLLSLPQGRSNRYVIDIPPDQDAGLYWYHPHIHGLSDDQVYEGLAGHIVVGRADGDYRELDGLTERTMMIRYNVVEPNAAGELVDASPTDTAGTATAPRGRMIYTVNGQAAPTIALTPADPATGVPAESQVWAFTNITGSATYILAMEEVDAADASNPDVVGRPVDLTVVSIDGTPMPAPTVLTGDAARQGYLLGQGGRVALLVQGASDPTKVVRLVQVQNRSGTGEASASNFPEGRMIGGYRDYTRTVLATSTGAPSAASPHVDTPPQLTPNRGTVDHGLLTEPVANSRTFVFNNVAPPTEETPNEFPVDFALFPDNPMAQPEVGTVEEWTILNYSPLHHPFHVHAQYNQVVSIDAPINPDFHDGPDQYPSVQYVTDLSQPDPAPYLQDVINLPPAKVGPDGMPILGPDGLPAEPGRIVLRMKIDAYLGTYVEHCHRLPHEDRGMMSLVRSIPHEPVAAITRAAEAGTAVDVVRAADQQVVATVTPFPGTTAPLVVAVGDIDRDAVPDVVAATTTAPAALAWYSGASGYRDAHAVAEPFGDDTTSAGSVASGDLNGDGFDDIVLGQGSGGSRVVVVDGASGNRLSDFRAYDDPAISSVSVAADILELGGRVSLVTGAGPGGAPTVNVYNVDLFGDADGNAPDLGAAGALTPLLVASVAGAEDTFRGGVRVSTGYPFASAGGFASILVSPAAGPVQLRTFRLGSHEHGHTVSASGVFLAEDHQPGTPRMLSAGPILDLRADPAFVDGAAAAFVSTPTGAELVAVPAAGGAAQRWTVAVDGALAPLAPLGPSAGGVAAM